MTMTDAANPAPESTYCIVLEKIVRIVCPKCNGDGVGDNKGAMEQGGYIASGCSECAGHGGWYRHTYILIDDIEAKIEAAISSGVAIRGDRIVGIKRAVRNVLSALKQEK